MQNRTKHIRRNALIVISLALLLSLTGNIYLLIRGRSSKQDKAVPWNIHVSDANTRETYRTVHHLEEAWKMSTGKGVRVGILDWGFAFKVQDSLYSQGVDFMTFEGHQDNFDNSAEHGLWMTHTLKEIAPDAEVVAIGCYDFDDSLRVAAMIKGIDWAIDNDIDILTLSHRQVPDRYRASFDQAVRKAVQSGITTCFIHYDLPENILPFSIEPCDFYNRQPDINILQHDYNTIILDNYAKYLEKLDYSYKDYVYYSLSSTAVVTGGIVALMKSVNTSLTPAQCKEILIRTSRPFTYDGISAPHVANAQAAVAAARRAN